MDFFKTYTSNTTAGSANQSFFASDGAAHTARVYYKLYRGGEYRYSLLFSNTTDSTYADGSDSRCNMTAPAWELLGVRVGLVPDVTMEKATEPAVFTALTFDGKTARTVEGALSFSSDPVTLCAAAGEFLCVELSYRGKRIPNHKELQIAAFVLADGAWVPSVDLPLPMMVGCDRPVSLRIGYLGDSITQGIGATKNSYRHYAAVTADLLGDAYAHWDLGIGYARAGDAASDGAWLYKVRQNDLVTVCLGVNDILQGKTAEQIKDALTAILMRLKDAGVRVVLQSVPPFDYSPERTEIWQSVNDYIERVLAPQADGYFDNRRLLSDPSAPQRAIYGGHPNDAGCRVWGEGLAAYLKTLLEGEAQ